MPDTLDSNTAETGGRKDDPPASQVQINFTGTAPGNILQLFLPFKSNIGSRQTLGTFLERTVEY
jgi:hypothetical protein